MSKGNEEHNEDEDQNYDDLFNPDNIDYEDEDDELDGLDGINEEHSEEDLEDENEEDEDLEDEEENEDDDNYLENNDEEDEDDSKDKFTEDDLKVFNKKLNTDFKSTEELAAYMNKEEQKDSTKEDSLALETANNAIAFYKPILELDDESLMRKQFETIAVKQGKDLNDEDVQIDVETQIQNLKDSHVLDVKADRLRDKLTSLNQDALNTKLGIEKKQSDLAEALKKTEKQELQNAFLEIGKTESFFGIDLDKKSISEAYKDVASGKFIDTITSDKKVQAELALMYKNREEIYKMASGLKYGDGMKAILDEFKGKKEAKNLSRAQRSGGSGGSAKSMNGLIADILYEKPDEE